MRRAFKYRVYPTKAQAAKLGAWLNLCRELHNAAIQERRDHWNNAGISVGFNDQSKRLPSIKQNRPEFAEVYSQVLQQALHRVDSAFQYFFRRVKNGGTPGYPRFKSADRYNSLVWPQDIGFRLVGMKRIRLSGIGEVKIKLHRPVGGTPKTLTVKREAGRWYAVFSCDAVPPRAYPDAVSEVGIDMGIESFATLSTGEKIENARWYRKAEKRMAEAQRALSRKKRGSKRRAKAKRRLARLRAKEKNQRTDFQHKLAHRIVSENAVVVVEDLKPKEMIEKSSTGLSKSIQDAAWSRFLSILEAKAEEAARRFVKVSPRGTSSTCSRCGAFRKKTLSERLHACPCGLVLDRDINASINILRLGRSLQVAS
ncbi:MAG: Transposase, IS605 OrfB family [Candidatus Gottesmanbacteria bacterium GW2011_GWB1_49_7]|uniref:Transposase, IS605 OrfB family n=1 Tax=Candidatus Gottesmanbacteria bacterium GW2011_GWB1_49_7 TaxID=1618448 RepID=A0A0G1Z343_9BACT|nr:MAG: Transposase, IS605 OrfB family [Candidatus Gottesmanbacteria bacterium GW2011_GWB1_49_7]